MAIFNFTGTISTLQQFTSADTVNFTGNTTIGAGGQIEKTDELGMNINMSAGVTVTINSTGVLIVKGQRGTREDPLKDMVNWISSAASPAAGDWGFITYNGATSTTSRHLWNTFQHATFAFVIQNYAAAEGDFRYLIGYKNTSGPAAMFDSGATKTSVITDVANFFYDAAWTKSGASTTTWKRIFFADPGATSASLVTKTCTINDLHVKLCATSPLDFRPAGGNTITMTGFYQRITDAVATPDLNGGAGDLEITTFQMRGGETVAHNQSSGNMNLTGGDVIEGINFAGIFSATTTGGDVDDVFLAGTNDFDLSVVSNGADSQISNMTSFTNVRVARKFDITHSLNSPSAVTANGFTITGTTGCRAKSRVVFRKVGSTAYQATDWDAPDATFKSMTLPSSMTDWVTLGKTFALDLNGGLALENLEEGTTYEFFVESINLMGETFRSALSTQATTAADTTPPVFAGIATAVDANNAGEVDLTWLAATDPGTGVGAYPIYFSTVSAVAATIIAEGIKLFAEPGATGITVGGLTNDVVHNFLVRAQDLAAPPNEDTNTVVMSATPTGAAGTTLIGPFTGEVISQIVGEVVAIT